ncbi:MAG: hypothetical protein IT233_13205 [Bacteroidia bacterium]|nr:hypothetical protein [Bacteroidia bacterium]
MKKAPFTFSHSLLWVVMFLFFLPATLSAQAPVNGEKNKIFSVQVTTQLNATDAVKLDQNMLQRKGILSCTTDAATGWMTIKVISQIDLAALLTVINYYGYEAKTSNASFKEE